MPKSTLPHTILAADWGDASRKRRAVSVDMESLTVRGVTPTDGTSLSRLTRCSPTAGTLIGIDAVVGIPRYIGDACSADDFFDWLKKADAAGQLFDPASLPEEWTPLRPFWRNPAGEGEQRRFFDEVARVYPAFPANHRLRRSVDPLSAKPPTCVSGMPGTVGSGTRELWRELLVPETFDALAIWPFDGRCISELLAGAKPVLVEAYPAVAYGVVLGDRLPARWEQLAKTSESVREYALDRLASNVAWVRQLSIEGGLLQAALASEDSFDALFLALALCRLALEGRLDPETVEGEAEVDSIFEGGIVGTWCVTREARRIAVASSHQLVDIARPDAGRVCPIPGCNFAFKMGRGGWDGHVASLRNHLNWHPEELDPERRKELFREEHGSWLRIAQKQSID